jgi:hypothetical protein
MSDLDLERNSERLELRVHPQDSETVSLSIPQDTLESLKEVAEHNEMPLEALLKFYIGKCLRQDLSQLNSLTIITASLSPRDVSHLPRIQPHHSGHKYPARQSTVETEFEAYSTVRQLSPN